MHDAFQLIPENVTIQKIIVYIHKISWIFSKYIIYIYKLFFERYPLINIIDYSWQYLFFYINKLKFINLILKNTNMTNLRRVSTELGHHHSREVIQNVVIATTENKIW